MSKNPPVVDGANDFDHFDEQWVQNPYPIWGHLRQQCPVAHTSLYKDIKAVALDPEHFSSRRVIINDEDLPAIPVPPINSDPPEHRAHRAVLTPYFNREAVLRYESASRAICRNWSGPWATKPTANGVADYAREIPSRVIAERCWV